MGTLAFVTVGDVNTVPSNSLGACVSTQNMGAWALPCRNVVIDLENGMTTAHGMGAFQPGVNPRVNAAVPQGNPGDTPALSNWLLDQARSVVDASAEAVYTTAHSASYGNGFSSSTAPDRSAQPGWPATQVPIFSGTQQRITQPSWAQPCGPQANPAQPTRAQPTQVASEVSSQLVDSLATQLVQRVQEMLRRSGYSLYHMSAPPSHPGIHPVDGRTHPVSGLPTSQPSLINFSPAPVPSPASGYPQANQGNLGAEGHNFKFSAFKPGKDA